MNEDNVIISVIQRLESLNLEYMLVGSYASNLWGRPRSSYDADIVADVGPGDAERFLDAFSDDFSLLAESLHGDLREGRMFNLIPKNGIFKVDIIPLRKTPFAREEFSRRRRVEALGHVLSVASPEDTILFKLVWYRRGGGASGRQLEDARDVWAIQDDTINRSYLEHWAKELKVNDLLSAVRPG